MNINYLAGLNLVLDISKNLKITNNNNLINNETVKQDKTTIVDELKQWNKSEKLKINECPKWDLKKIPLNFFINLNINNEKFEKEFIDAARNSFLAWSRASYGLIRFQETFNKKYADIIIDWSDSVVFGRDFEVGQCDLKVVNNKIEKAEIIIIIYPMIDRLANKSSRIERVRRTSLHEAGHALGLNHSNSSKDIMFHRGINNKNLSFNDSKRLNELYKAKTNSILS